MTWKNSAQILASSLLLTITLASGPARAKDPVKEVRLYAIECGRIEVKDMGLQRNTKPKLNAAAEAAAAAHDATTRNLIEQILADEELHFSWLETELELYEKLGEALYTASRLQSGTKLAGRS